MKEHPVGIIEDDNDGCSALKAICRGRSRAWITQGLWHILAKNILPEPRIVYLVPSLALHPYFYKAK